MQRIPSTKRLAGVRSWWLGALLALLLLAVAPTPAGAASRGTGQGASAPVPGWGAGPVSRGTGFWTAGGSQRVREVQRGLHRLGYHAGPIDGLFGPLTDGAVRRYQTRHGLISDGIVGARTHRSLVARTEAARDATARNNGNRASQTAQRRPVTGADRADRTVESPAGLPSLWILGLLVPIGFAAALLCALLLLRIGGTAQS